MPQAIGVSARPTAPATASGSGTSSRRSRWTVIPAAPATSSADSRFMRKASSPSGCRTTDATQPTRTYAGKPVGCIVPISGRTVWASAVSHAKTPGRSVDQ